MGRRSRVIAALVGTSLLLWLAPSAEAGPVGRTYVCQLTYEATLTVSSTVLFQGQGTCLSPENEVLTATIRPGIALGYSGGQCPGSISVRLDMAGTVPRYFLWQQTALPVSIPATLNGLGQSPLGGSLGGGVPIVGGTPQPMAGSLVGISPFESATGTTVSVARLSCPSGAYEQHTTGTSVWTFTVTPS